MQSYLRDFGIAVLFVLLAFAIFCLGASVSQFIYIDF